MKDDLISRAAAIRAIRHWLLYEKSTKTPCEVLSEMPSAQPEITPDGTLNISINADVASVGRILLSQAGTQRGGLYYKDAQPEIIRCLDCKYYDEVNQPYPQMYCRKHSIDTSDQDFCSRAERKDDE